MSKPLLFLFQKLQGIIPQEFVLASRTTFQAAYNNEQVH